VVALAALVVLAAMSTTTVAQTTTAPPAPPQPFAPEWAMLAGWDLFAKKNCGKCHSLRGAGSTVGPDLAGARTGTSFFEIGAAMWNHLPRMGARMREAGIERARLTPLEAGHLIAFLFTARYFDASGDPRRGESLFAAKACASCHAVGGKGGTVGPPLDPLKRANSPVLVAAAMWNHAPAMSEAFKRQGVARPTFTADELLDIIAYVGTAGRDSGGETRQVIPGTPDRGRVLFAEKRCASCHAVGGVGPKIGPDLGRAGHHISLTAFAARMWNHAPAMIAKMKEQQIEPPTLSGQDMADVVAYLFTTRYFESTASARRGEQLVQGKGCLGCHAVAGKGAKGGVDFARSSVVSTPSAVIASMWNHGGVMAGQAEKRQVAWPELRGAELADISAYLAAVSRQGARKPASR
jgi:mono/diheme cytochrome c family protein